MAQQRETYQSIVNAANGIGDDPNVWGADNIASVYAQERANLMNMAIADATNRSNRKIARETNDMNYKMAQEKNALDYRIFKETNEYNTPEAQVQRYLDAGINPIAAVSSGSIGSGNAANYQTALATAVPGAPMVGAQMQAPSFFDSDNQLWNGFATVGNQVKNFADSMLNFGRLENETGLAGSQIAFNQYKMAETEANTKKTLAETNTLIPLQARSILKDMQKTDSDIELNKTKGRDIESEIQLRKAQERLWQAQADKMREDVRVAWANYNLGKDRIGLDTDRLNWEKEKFPKELDLEERKLGVDSHSNPWKTGVNLFKNFLSHKAAAESQIRYMNDDALYSTFMYLSEHPLRVNGSITQSAELSTKLYGELARRYERAQRHNVQSANTPGSVENPMPVQNQDTYDQ